MELAQVPTPDCGPTPNSSVYVNQSLATASWSFSTSLTANPTYNNLQEAYYNTNRYQTIFLQQNYSKTSLTQTIRNDTTLDCQNYNFSTSSVALKITGAHWNKIKNCNIRTTGANNYGIHILTSVGNELINNLINASGTTAYGVYFLTNANHNQVINTTFLGSAANDVYTSSSTNNTLINTSFARGDFGFTGTASILIKWYVNVNVTDGTNQLNLANVGIYNNTAGLLYSGTTDTSGTTGKQILQEFIQSSATDINYNTPHNITGNLTGYNSNSTLVNLTQTNSTTINLVLTNLIINTAPNTISVFLNATSIKNYTTDNLTCYTNITDADEGNIYANYTWYKNNITNLSGQSGPYASGTLNLVTNLTFGNTTKNEQWICSVIAYDGTAYEADWNNASIVIRDSPPTAPSLDLPFNNTNTSDNTPFFNWTTSIDADNDAITYRIEIANDSAFTQYAQVNESIVLYNNYTALTLGDKTYYWRVESNTSEANSNWSGWRVITIDTIPPLFFNAVNTSLSFKRYSNFTANITINDSIGLNHYIFSTNASGVWENLTNFSISGLSYNLSVSKNISATQSDTICWYYWANDTVGNANRSETYCFNVNNTAPTISNLILNSTFGTNLTTENLTIHYIENDIDEDLIENITNWYKNGNSLTVLNMPFEEINDSNNNNAWDYSGNNYNASENGAIIWNASGGHDSKGAYEFNGSTDYLENNVQLVSNYPFTITAWVKTKSLTGQTIVSLVDKDVTDVIYTLDITSSGGIGFSIDNGTETPQSGGFSSGKNDGNWHFLVAIYNNNSARNFYLDGKWVGSNTNTISYNTAVDRFSIGRIGDSSPSAYFNGTIDEVKVFNIVLTAQQVLVLNNSLDNLIVSTETNEGETWQACVTPNDGTTDGSIVCSNNLTIRDTISPLVSWINPSNGSNFTRTSYNQTFNASVLELNAQSVLFSFDNATGNKFNVTAVNGSGSWAVQYNVSSLAEGSHTVIVIANDSAGNINNNQQINFVADFTIPGVNWITPADQQAYSATAYNQIFNLSVSELNFVNRVLLSFNNATGIPFNVTASNGSGYWTASINISGLAEGTHTVTAIANDSAGNVNNTEQRTFTLDKTAPVVSWINPTNYSNYTWNTFNITFNTSVLDLSAQSVLFSFDNASGAGFNITAINGSGSWAVQYNVSSLAEGSHIVTVIANDSVGNINNNQQINFIVDYTAPGVAWVTPSDQSNYSGTAYNQTFNISVLELNFVNRILLSFNNASGIPFNITATNGSGSWAASVNISALTEGTHLVTAIANDSTGNVNNTEQRTFTLDKTAPVVSWINPTNYSNYTWNTFNITFNTSVLDLSAQSVLFSFDNASGAGFNITAINGSGSWAAQYNVSSLAEGSHIVTIIANDSVGNVNNLQTIIFTVDNTAPTVNWINPTNGSNFTRLSYNQTFNASVLELNFVQSVLFSFDNASGNNFNITATNGSGYWTVQYNVSSLAEGTHFVSVIANDSAGNINNSQQITFIIDNTAPRATWITPVNNSNYSITAYNQTFNLSVSEENFVQSVLFSFDNASGNNFNVTASNGSGYWNALVNVSGLTEGIQTVIAIVNDSSGNTNNTQQITFTTDFTAPTFINAKNTSINFKRYQNFTANITINDNIIGLQYLIFSANGSGIWDNSTNQSISGLQYNASLSKNITLPKGSQVCWYYWANDSLGNKNQSTENCFTVINTPPTFNETLTDKPVTVGNDLSYKINCSDIDADTITYYDNTTLFDINGITGLISDTPVAGEAGFYSINITCGDSEENISQKFTYTITAAPTPEPAPAPSGGGGGGAASAGCVKDTDCKADQYCQDSICYDYECTSNKQCEKDKYCVNHNCLKIFDLKILQVDSPLQPGEFLDFSYFMKGMANISGDVTLNFWLEKGIEKATSGTDVIFMGNFEEKIEEGNLFLPSTIEEGKYKFNVKLTFDGYEIVSSRLVEVLKETPLLVNFVILDLPKIEVDKPWDYSAILSVNKDEPLPLNLKQKITKQSEEVWFKESNLILEKSLVIKEKVPGLETGEYTLELEAVYGSETVSAKQSFTVGEPKVGAIAGAATGEITEWFNKSWPILVGLLLVILLSILISTLIRKKEEEPSLERLEQWVNKMSGLGKSKEEVKKLILDTGWSDQELETVFRKIERTQEIKNSSNFSDEDLKKLGDYIYAQHKSNINKEEVIKQLLEAGWPKKVIEKFLAVYYES